MIIEAVKAGNLGKAVTLIDSNGIAPTTQGVFEQINALLNPQEPSPFRTKEHPSRGHAQESTNTLSQGCVWMDL